MFVPKSSILERLFKHELEQPRSILCFYASWPIAIILLPMAAVDWLAREHISVALELLGAAFFFATPLYFKTESQYAFVRVAFSVVLFSGFLTVLFLRLDTAPGQIWLPLFPILGYILLGDRSAHFLVAAMWVLFLAFAPFGELGLQNSVMLTCGLLISTVVANKYESALRMYHARLSQLADKDPLTGIANRRSMLGHLEDMPPARQIAVLMIDVDYFKRINDEHGHAAGDRTLRLLGKQFEGLMRDGQHVGRWGGDEFIVTLPEVDEALAEAIARRLQMTVRQGGGPAFSVGVAIRGQNEDVASLLHRADQALYRAKTEGRDQIRLAAPVSFENQP